MSTPTASRQYIHIDPRQLCIGLHVHLELQWTEHPFPLSSFKIRTAQQLAQLQALGLKSVRIVPARCDTRPLAAPPPAAAQPSESTAPAQAEPSAEQQQLAQAKRERLQRLQAQRQQMAAREHELLKSSRVVKSISQNLFSAPDRVHQETAALIDTIAGSMLVDRDISIHLTSERVSGEEVYQHALNVALLAMTLAKELQLPPETVRAIGLGALFHDVGKIDMPDRVVRKTEPHTRAEIGLLQQHCLRGLEMLKPMELPVDVQAVVAQHHEMIDGSGYPRRLVGAQIALPAKIVAIANRFDRLCNPSNPAAALTPHEALSLMFSRQREQFEPAALMTFVRCLGIYPPGTIVALNIGVLGMVTSVNSTRPLKPTVLIYDPLVPPDEAVPLDLEQEPELAIARALRPQQLPPEAHDHLNPRRHVCYVLDETKPA